MNATFTVRLLVLSAGAAVITSLTTSCSDPPQAPPPLQNDAVAKHAWSTSTRTPSLVVLYDAGMPADPDSRSSGARLAVWEDGVVLQAADPRHPDRWMRVGRLTSEQAAAAWAAFEQSGFFSEPDTFLVAPDSEHVKIMARSGGGAGVTRTHTLDAYYQSQTAWWPRVEAALEKFSPDSTWPVTEVAQDGAFRGFVVAEWWRTPWVR